MARAHIRTITWRPPSLYECLFGEFIVAERQCATGMSREPLQRRLRLIQRAQVTPEPLLFVFFDIKMVTRTLFALAALIPHYLLELDVEERALQCLSMNALWIVALSAS